MNLDTLMIPPVPPHATTPARKQLERAQQHLSACTLAWEETSSRKNRDATLEKRRIELRAEYEAVRTSRYVPFVRDDGLTVTRMERLAEIAREEGKVNDEIDRLTTELRACHDEDVQAEANFHKARDAVNDAVRVVLLQEVVPALLAEYRDAENRLKFMQGALSRLAKESYDTGFNGVKAAIERGQLLRLPQRGNEEDCRDYAARDNKLRFTLPARGMEFIKGYIGRLFRDANANVGIGQ